MRLIASSALVAGLLMVAPAAQGATTLSLDVTFSVNGTITVALPDGTPVGSTSGAPTVIPAGFYRVMLSGPGGCTAMPHFDLLGPGQHIFDNMNEGESENVMYNAYFLPNSTYTWRSDATPAVVHTFITTADAGGTPASSGYHSTGNSTASSQDVVGSARVLFRGTLTGVVSAAGRLTLAFKGKSVTSLKAGRYTITVADQSATNGVMLEKIKHKAVSVTGAAFVGKHSGKVNLTAGRWFFTPRLVGKKTYFIVVK